jgi:FMN phosphatase YigB (HAD superfamily)
MKVFFDVDGVLIDGWHADVSRRLKPISRMYRKSPLDFRRRAIKQTSEIKFSGISISQKS